MKHRMEAAYKVINCIITDEFINSLLEQSLKQYDTSKGDVISVVRPVKVYDNIKNSYNMLTNMFSQELLIQLDKKMKEKHPDKKITFKDEPVMMLTTSNRTQASSYERILKQPFFDATQLRAKNIIINDDHINAGAFTATLFAAAKELDANILAVSSLTVHPHTRNLALDGRLLRALKQYTEEAEPNTAAYDRLNLVLSTMGLSMETLTNREALTLLTIIMDGNNNKHQLAFDKLDKTIKNGHNVIDGKGDSLNDVLQEVPLTVSALIARIGSDVQSNKFRM